MKKPSVLLLTMVLFLSLAARPTLTKGAPAAGDMKKGVKSLPADKQVNLAESAAPMSISTDATIMVYAADGKLTEARKGQNGFTCVPDISGQEKPDPICMDKAAYQWFTDAMTNAPKPANTVPGIAYMARGGWHWEKDGKITPMGKNEPGDKRVKEPPHWMILYPFDAKAGGIPATPGRFGTYIMYEGTPYAHLMIYQDPARLTQAK
ncbi:MAG: hypothetical protein HY883_03160 [Deltaproteobacteria bacterium]|nr:hypothetical protein [Deltaproteobacteria bacterium]